MRITIVRDEPSYSPGLHIFRQPSVLLMQYAIATGRIGFDADIDESLMKTLTKNLAKNANLIGPHAANPRRRAPRSQEESGSDLYSAVRVSLRHILSFERLQLYSLVLKVKKASCDHKPPPHSNDTFQLHAGTQLAPRAAHTFFAPSS